MQIAVPVHHSRHPFRALRAYAGAGTVALGAVSLAIFLFALLDALTRPSAAYDPWGMRQLQRFNDPTAADILIKIERLTDSTGAVLAWLVVLTAFVAARWWAWAAVVALVPSGGVVNLAVAEVVARARPHLDDATIRSSQNFEARSFPSGHAMGAVMLYGVIFVAAGGLRWPLARLIVRGICLGVIAASGYQRVWGGAHWPSDVVAGVALGGFMLAGLLVCRSWLVARGPCWRGNERRPGG